MDRAGVKQNERGQIIADDYQNTNVDGIYSLGDVCGKIELTPVAIAAGRQLANRLFGGPDFKNARLDYTNIPSVVFAHPEVGSIGMTEPQAREKYGDKVKVYNTSFTAMYYAMMEADEKAPTSYKLVCVGAEEKVVRTSLAANWEPRNTVWGLPYSTLKHSSNLENYNRSDYTYSGRGALKFCRYVLRYPTFVIKTI